MLRIFLAFFSILLLSGGLVGARAQTRGAITVNIPGQPGQPDKLHRLYSKSYALVIGINEYSQRGWSALQGAVADAAAVAAELRRHGFEVTEKPNPTSVELRAVLREFLIRTGSDPDARLLLWFAGHGHTLPQSNAVDEGYIVPADAPDAGTKDVPNKDFLHLAVPIAELGTWMAQARAKHILAVFDSCFSGAALAIGKSAEVTAPAAISLLTEGKARQVISSGNAGQKVNDDGQFRKLFINAIQGHVPGVGANGYLTGVELGTYLKREMTRLTVGKTYPQTPNHGYINKAGFDQGDFVFEIIRPDGTRPRQVAPKNPAPASGAAPGLQSFRVDRGCIKEWKDGLITSRDPEVLGDFAYRCSGTLEALLAQDRVMLFAKPRTETASSAPAKPAGSKDAGDAWRTTVESTPVASVLPDITGDEAAEWRLANAVNTRHSYQEFMDKWPQSVHLDEAKAELAKQLRRTYSLLDVERSARRVGDAIRGKTLVYDKIKIDGDDADGGECKLDPTTTSLLRGVAVSWIYYHGLMSYLRYGELREDVFPEIGNYNSVDEPTSNPRVLGVDVNPAELLAALARVRSQRMPFSARDLRDIKTLARELLTYRTLVRTGDALGTTSDMAGIDRAGGRKGQIKPCYEKSIALSGVGITLSTPKGGSDPFQTAYYSVTLDDYLRGFWKRRLREGTAEIAEIVLKYIQDN